MLEASEALTGAGSVLQSDAQFKAKLIEDGVLVAEGSDRLRFVKPWPFSSPSAAAGFVLDRNANGRIEWKVEGTSQSYHDWQAQQAAARD